MEDDFSNLREYNDYLEHVELIIANLVNEVDVDKIEDEMRKYRDEHAEEIERNRRRMNTDDLWINDMLVEESKAQARNQEYTNDVTLPICFSFNSSLF